MIFANACWRLAIAVLLCTHKTGDTHLRNNLDLGNLLEYQAGTGVHMKVRIDAPYDRLFGNLRHGLNDMLSAVADLRRGRHSHHSSIGGESRLGNLPHMMSAWEP